MNKKLKEMNIGIAVNMADEIRQMASSLAEDVTDSTCMTDAWKKIDKFYQDVEGLRNMQKCTGSKSFSVLHDSVKGHTKYLQGIDLPIMVNSIWENENHCAPSSVSEMHIGTVDGKLTLLITPEIITLPQDDKKIRDKANEEFVEKLENEYNNIPLQYENTYEDGFSDGLLRAIEIIRGDIGKKIVEKMNERMNRIKPCKFCGETPKIYNYGIRMDNEYWIRCENDNCTERPFTSPYDTETEAVEIWNKKMEC